LVDEALSSGRDVAGLPDDLIEHHAEHGQERQHDEDDDRQQRQGRCKVWTSAERPGEARVEGIDEARENRRQEYRQEERLEQDAERNRDDDDEEKQEEASEAMLRHEHPG